MKIPESIRPRMLPELVNMLEEALDTIPICERPAATVDCEVISATYFNVKVYYPRSPGRETHVIVHYPGGISKDDINRDKPLCAGWAEEGFLVICVNFPSAPDANFEQILTYCKYAHELARDKCSGEWKAEWKTDPSRVWLSGSSIGATLAFLVAAIASQDGIRPSGLMAIVPVMQTDPRSVDDPWGKNKDTIGLTHVRLLTDLDNAFANVPPNFRSHWKSNPWKMPNDVLQGLPPIAMVSATLDILYKSQMEFKDRLLALGVQVDCKEVNGLHQVKEMYQTKDGRALARYVTSKMVEMANEPMLD